MSRPHQQWKVLPHGDLVKIDEGILTVVGKIRMPLMDLPRRMTVVRLGDSRLVIFSAIALDERAMAKLDAFGLPAFLIVPNAHHRLDAKPWKDRYPQVQVAAPKGAREKVAEIVPVDTVEPDFGDPDVRFMPVGGTGDREGALMVRTPGGTTLVLNDVVGNIRSDGGIDTLLLRLAGFAGPAPRIPKVVKLAMVSDAPALRGQLLQWAEIESLARILVSHGEPVEANPRQVLRDLANALG